MAEPGTAQDAAPVAAPETVHPPFGASVARGLWATTRSPVLVASTFLAVLGLWAGFTAYLQVQPVSPAALVLFLALPPVHSFLDLQYLSLGGSGATALAVAFGGGLVVVRALFAGFWIALIVGSLRGEPQGWGAVRPAFRQAGRRLAPLIGVEAAFLGLAVLTRLVDVLSFSFGLGQLGTVAALLAGLYFLVFAPMAVVTDGLDVRSAVRRSVRAARLPGPRHLLLAFGYIAVVLVMSSVSPAGRVAPASPTIAIWAYGLFVNFVNMTVLAAFTYRWVTVHDSAALDAPSPPRRALSGRPSLLTELGRFGRTPRPGS